jgi:elongation factor P
MIEVDGQPFEVVDYERHKMQQRAPVTRLRLKNLKDGRVLERVYQRYDTEFPVADVQPHEAQYLFTDGRLYHFMDLETYDQYPLSKEQLGDSLMYLKENDRVEVVFFRGEMMNIKLPTFVDLAVSETPPGVKGDTAQGGNKPAVLETGITIQVPMFVEIGQVVRVDTRSGDYTERVS